MKVILQIVFIALILSSTFVYAEEEFQMQVSVSEIHFEVGDDFESDDHLIFVSHYFTPVQTTGHPLAEAAFFERIGGISLHVSSGEFKDGPFEADRFSYGVLVSFAKPRDPITGQVSYSTTDTEFNFPIVGGFLNERYGFNLGYFLRDNLHLNFTHGRSKSERSIIGLPKVDFKDQSYAINVKWVEKLPKKKAFNLQGGLRLNRFDDPTEEGENWIVSLSGDYYLNRKISIGVGTGINRGDEERSEGEAYFADVLAFLNPNFSINLFYEDFSARNSGEDDDTFYRLSLIARF